MIRLFDAHTHLNFEEYSAAERAALAAEIEDSAVGCIVDAGDSVASSEQAIRDAERYDWCYAAVGIHPQHAARVTLADIGHIRRLAAHDRVKAIGEIGLDFHYGKEDRAAQIRLFRAQLALALEIGLPIMVHTRDADQLTLDMLEAEGAFSAARTAAFPPRPDGQGGEMADARVQLHCYSGSVELARQYVALGATVSIGGPLTFKNARRPAEVVRAVPGTALLSETDAPYLAPEPLRGRPNRSPYIEHVVRRMALLRDLSYEAMAELSWQNGCRFFAIADRA